jgi:hypothetical protein
MTPPPPAGRPPKPVRIEVPATKVDATLDLVQIMESIAASAQRVSKARKAQRAAHPAGAEAHLEAVAELAGELAAHLSALEDAAPELRHAIEQAEGTP